jgi:hypothetical protein
LQKVFKVLIEKQYLYSATAWLFNI